MSHLDISPLDGSTSRNPPPSGALEGRSLGPQISLPGLTLQDYDSSALTSESDLHAYLASKLFDPPDHSASAELNTSSHDSPSNLTWDPTPTPESYQTNSWSLSGTHTEGLASTPSAFDGRSIGTAGPEQIAIDQKPGKFSADGSRRKEKRKQGPNSKGQKRGAQVPEDKADTIYDQLERTISELNELKKRHQQLESKNLLLEKCLHLEHSKNLQHTSGEEISCEDRYIAQETINTEHGTSVSVSIRGEPRNMTIYEIGKIEVPQFATLWTGYIQTIGACLVQMGHSTQGPSADLMQRLTVESSQLLGCIQLLNHKVHKAMLQGQMDSKLAKAHSIDKFYQTYVALLMLSKEQFQDLEMLRCIYLTRRAGLAKERKMLVHQAARSLSHAEETVPLPGNTRVANLAARLQELAQEDYIVYHRVAAAVRRGVLSTKQWAAFIVHAYPYMPDIENSFEAIAKADGRPPKQVIQDDRTLGNMAAEWQALQQYLELIARHNTHDYVPLSVQSALLSGANRGPL